MSLGLSDQPVSAGFLFFIFCLCCVFAATKKSNYFQIINIQFSSDALEKHPSDLFFFFFWQNTVTFFDAEAANQSIKRTKSLQMLNTASHANSPVNKR